MSERAEEMKQRVCRKMWARDKGGTNKVGDEKRRIRKNMKKEKSNKVRGTL